MDGPGTHCGDNDKSGDKPTRYKEHLANLIRDIRSEFKAQAVPRGEPGAG